MSTGFASTNDMAAKTITFAELGPGCYAFTAEGDPNTGIVVGDDGVLVMDAQATPRMAHQVLERIASVTDKPVTHVVLSHYHAVRVLGASAYGAPTVIASNATRDLIVERGQQDWDSEFGRFPRLFEGHESIPGLTWPSITFDGEMSVYLGSREVRIMHLGRGHTAGDTVAYIPDAKVMFSGDLVEYHSACYCGDAHYGDWPNTLDRLLEFDMEAIVPGRGDALVGRAQIREGIELTKDFLSTLYGAVKEAVAQGKSLQEAYDHADAAMRPRFGDFVIYDHCMPFNVSRAYDEAKGMDRPQIWTAQRDIEMWKALQAR